MLEALASIACLAGFGILYVRWLVAYGERHSDANIKRDFPNFRSRKSAANDNMGVF